MVLNSLMKDTDNFALQIQMSGAHISCGAYEKCEQYSGPESRRGEGIFVILMEDSGKINVKECSVKPGLDLSASGQGLRAESCEHYCERSCFIKSGFFLKNSE